MTAGRSEKVSVFVVHQAKIPSAVPSIQQNSLMKHWRCFSGPSTAYVALLPLVIFMHVHMLPHTQEIKGEDRWNGGSWC